MFIENTIGKIKDNSIQLLSIDIFDTLLFRLVDQPKQIFSKIGKKAIQSNLLHNSIAVEEFTLLRIKAEQTSRKNSFKEKGHSEVTLEQIYRYLPISSATKPNSNR